MGHLDFTHHGSSMVVKGQKLVPFASKGLSQGGLWKEALICQVVAHPEVSMVSIHALSRLSAPYSWPQKNHGFTLAAYGASLTISLHVVLCSLDFGHLYLVLLCSKALLQTDELQWHSVGDPAFCVEQTLRLQLAKQKVGFWE